MVCFKTEIETDAMRHSQISQWDKRIIHGHVVPAQSQTGAEIGESSLIRIVKSVTVPHAYREKLFWRHFRPRVQFAFCVSPFPKIRREKPLGNRLTGRPRPEGPAQ